MSDKHDEHDQAGHGADHDGGGHEIDRMPNAWLFKLLFGLSGLTLLAGFGVIELFNVQVAALEDSRAHQGSFRLAAYREEMQKIKTSSGSVKISELDDKATVNTRYVMPVASARKLVLDDTNRLKAFGAYAGWKTSDEQAPAAVAPAGARPGVPGAPDPAGRGAIPAGAAPGAPVPIPSREPAVPTDGAKPVDGNPEVEVAGPAAGGKQPVPASGAAETPPAKPKPTPKPKPAAPAVEPPTEPAAPNP